MSAPRPQLSDDSYKEGFMAPQEGEPIRIILTEFEPLFDAADVIKCGRDVFIAQSSCCNRFGIDWLQRHLGDCAAFAELALAALENVGVDPHLGVRK